VQVFLGPNEIAVQWSPPAAMVYTKAGDRVTLIAALAVPPVVINVNVWSSDCPTATLP
jgi:hypothetical protein